MNTKNLPYKRNIENTKNESSNNSKFINIKQDRVKHRQNLCFYYKKIFNFLNKELLEDKFDQNGVSKSFDYNQFNSLSINHKKLIDINSIVNYKDSNLDILLSKFIYGLPFQIFLTIVIFLNSIMLAVQTDSKLKKDYQSILEFLDSFTNSVFFIEFILKILYGFKIYWLNIYNLFDFFLLIIGLISLMTDIEYSKSFSASRLFRIFRVLRALRSLRSIHILHKMQIIVNTFFKSIYDMINIVALMLLSMIMFSLLGCSFFSGKVNGYFKDLGTGMLTIFYCATREGLSDLFNAVSTNYPKEFWLDFFWKMFIIILIILFAFILTNLIVAVVVTNMQQALKDENKNKDLNSKDTNLKNNLKFAKIRDISKDFEWSTQRSVETSYLQDLSIDKLEKYSLILGCIDQNLVECDKIKYDLTKIVDVVKNLNETQTENIKKSNVSDFEETHEQDSFLTELKSSQEIDWDNIVNDGDIISNLIDLEKKNIFSSEQVYDFKSIGKASTNKALLDIQFKRPRLSSLSNLDNETNKKLLNIKSYSSLVN